MIFVFYDNYRKLCLEQGGTPTGIAAELGSSKSSVSGWKNRGAAPHGDQLTRIAARLNVSVEYLLSGEADQKEKPLVNDDEELTEYLEELKTRPEMRMLFPLTKSATKEDVDRAVRIIGAAPGK